MARKPKKKRTTAKRRKTGSRRRSRKQILAAKRNIKKAQAARRRKSKRKGAHRKSKAARRRQNKHGHRKNKKSRRRRKRHAQSGFAASNLQVYQKLINKGYSPARAHKVAARLERMRKGKIGRYFSNEAAETERTGRLANMFSGFAMAAKAHKAIS